MNVDKPRAKSNDPGWKYAFWPTTNDKNTVQCDLCDTKFKGGIYRLKQHLVGGFKNATVCTKVTTKIQSEISEYLNRNKRLKLDDKDNIAAEYGPRGTESTPNFQLQNSSKVRNQQREVVIQKIAKWMHQASIPPESIMLKSFKVAVDAIGEFGPGIEVPSYHEVRCPLLLNEVQNTRELHSFYKSAWEKYGCTIIIQEYQQASMIYFFISCPEGTFFARSYYFSGNIEDRLSIFRVLDDIVLEIGADNVAQVVIANPIYFDIAVKINLGQRRIYFNKCPASYMNELLENLFSHPLAKNVIKCGMVLTSFIHRHKFLHRLVTKRTGGKEIVRSGATRHINYFLNLESLYYHRGILKDVFSSGEWNQMHISRCSVGKGVSTNVSADYWWIKVKDLLDVARPMIEVLRLVCNDEKPAMPFLYSVVESAREIVQKLVVSDYKELLQDVAKKFGSLLNESLYRAAFFLNNSLYYNEKAKSKNDCGEFEVAFVTCVKKIVGNDAVQAKILTQVEHYKNCRGLFGSEKAIRLRLEMLPHLWWDTYGNETKELQAVALRILGLACSSSVYERHLGMISKIHPSNQTRYDEKRLHDVMFVKYNERLRERFIERQAKPNTYDPIAFAIIESENEWLTGLDPDEKHRQGIIPTDSDLNFNVLGDLDMSQLPESIPFDDDMTQAPDSVSDMAHMMDSLDRDDSEYLDVDATDSYEIDADEVFGFNKQNGDVLAGAYLFEDGDMTKNGSLVADVDILHCGEIANCADEGSSSTCNDADSYPECDPDLEKNSREFSWWIIAAESIKRYGNDFFKKQDYTMALVKYRKALGYIDVCLEKDGIDEDKREGSRKLKSQIYTNSSACKLKLGDLKGALQDTEFAMRDGETNAKALFRQGQAHVALDNIDAAAESFRKALEMEPNDVAIKKEYVYVKKKIVDRCGWERKACQRMLQ